MEQPTQQGGESLTDEQRIYHHIVAALLENRLIDHATARAIAAQLHGGQDSALYALALSGAVVEGLGAELDGLRTRETPIEVEPWLEALDEYLDSRADQPEAVDGWNDLWPSRPPGREDDEPETGEEERPPYGSPTCAIGRMTVSANVDTRQPEDDEAETRQALFERVSAAGVTTLGEIATVHAPGDEDEPDTFPWTDAATWSRAEAARDNYDEPRYSAEDLDTLFGEPPDEEVGSVAELGWYGLVRHAGRPGGLILRCDEQGFRHVVGEAHADDALDVLWAILWQEYETYYKQRDAYELATAEPSDTLSGQNPQIWVGSLSDYNNGRLYGVWMDATLEPDALHDATQFMLRTGGAPGAEEWSIFDHDGFGGYEVSEWSSFATVSLVAQGIAEHGAAYAAWVNYVGDTSGELLEPDRFRDHYLGEWDSLDEYVEEVLQEADFYQRLDRALEAIPENLRQYVTVDVAGVAEEWRQGLHVVERQDGGVWVFDGRG